MNRYLLDSNVLMHVVNRAKGFGFIEARLLQAKADTVLVSAVTVWEIFRAAEKGKVPGRAAAAALALVSEFKAVPLTREAAALGGSICARLAKIGLTIGERDSMIAGSAVAHGFTMVTDNTGEFGRIPGLLVENWRINPN